MLAVEAEKVASGARKAGTLKPEEELPQGRVRPGGRESSLQPQKKSE